MFQQKICARVKLQQFTRILGYQNLSSDIAIFTVGVCPVDTFLLLRRDHRSFRIVAVVCSYCIRAPLGRGQGGSAKVTWAVPTCNFC